MTQRLPPTPISHGNVPSQTCNISSQTPGLDYDQGTQASVSQPPQQHMPINSPPGQHPICEPTMLVDNQNYDSNDDRLTTTETRATCAPSSHKCNLRGKHWHCKICGMNPSSIQTCWRLHGHASVHVKQNHVGTKCHFPGCGMVTSTEWEMKSHLVDSHFQKSGKQESPFCSWCLKFGVASYYGYRHIYVHNVDERVKKEGFRIADQVFEVDGPPES
ncbi:hypothetical protein F4778DRAFT_43736 [Xylariomycetidae sp. FL2044]|nr:hypothetical protein F4778DRAFT_43736 [Xylariomycetidae sp. FL2044]